MELWIPFKGETWMYRGFSKTNFPSKAAVVIDGGYWRKIQEGIGTSSIDLVSLTDCICEPAYRIRTYFFDGKTQESQSFHDSLLLLDRFEVYLGEVVSRNLTCSSCNETIKVITQKRVDVALAVELVHLATTNQVDLIVLLAGDRDFIPAIITAKHAGVIIRLVHGHPKTVSDSLYQLVDEKIELSQNFFKKNKIKFEIGELKEKLPDLMKIEEEEKIQIESEINKIIERIESILIDLITKTSEEYIGLSKIGIELTKYEPNWKEKTKIKHLNEIIKLADKKFKIKKIKNHYYISTLREVLKEISKEKDVDTLENFILGTLNEYINESQNESISMLKLGGLLSQKNPEWKKKYEVKKLKYALEILKEKILVSEERTDFKVKLKE